MYTFLPQFYFLLTVKIMWVIVLYIRPWFSFSTLYRYTTLTTYTGVTSSDPMRSLQAWPVVAIVTCLTTWHRLSSACVRACVRACVCYILLCMHVCFCCVGFSFSVLSREIGWEERFWNDLGLFGVGCMMAHKRPGAPHWLHDHTTWCHTTRKVVWCSCSVFVLLVWCAWSLALVGHHMGGT